MTNPSLSNLPTEIIYLIFEYLSQKDITYGFIELNTSFFSLVKYFLGPHLNLSTIAERQHFHFSFTTVLPLVGPNLRSLTLNSSFPLLPYIQTIKSSCPQLQHLQIVCLSPGEDIRHFVKACLHRGLKSLTLMHNGEIVHRSLAQRLLTRCQTDESFQSIETAAQLTFHLSSTNDTVVLTRFCESQEISDGVYVVQCSGTNRWLTDTKEDLCLLPVDCDENHLFTVRQIDPERCPLEYELFHAATGRILSVLISEECSEYFPATSILSTQRKLSPRACSTFTFERHDEHGDDFYIRPFYGNAKRLQTHGKRIIVSTDPNETTVAHRFKLHRLS